ncbi:hypothetical protein [Bacillus sp. FJAT-45350]|uniref:hypothetical protein n=1 Tax=Bacillus sp. FJAT-45350 TaxID=2011014 RepID=UPI000BB851F7|nr:hypothetical protein [Bacillus sp. FJAT-45350]
MEREMIIVLTAVALFFTAGTFAAFGIYNVLKNKKQKAFILFSIGFSCIATYIIGLFAYLHLTGL